MGQEGIRYWGEVFAPGILSRPELNGMARNNNRGIARKPPGAEHQGS